MVENPLPNNAIPDSDIILDIRENLGAKKKSREKLTLKDLFDNLNTW